MSPWCWLWFWCRFWLWLWRWWKPQVCPFSGWVDWHNNVHPQLLAGTFQLLFGWLIRSSLHNQPLCASIKMYNFLMLWCARTSNLRFRLWTSGSRWKHLMKKAKMVSLRSTSTWQTQRRTGERKRTSRGSRLRSWRQTPPPQATPPATPALPPACPVWAARSWRAPPPKPWCLEHQSLPPPSENRISRWSPPKLPKPFLSPKGACSEQWGDCWAKSRFCVEAEKENQVCFQEQEQLEEDEGRIV